MTHLEQELKTTAGNRLGVEPGHQVEAFQLHGLTGLLESQGLRTLPQRQLMLSARDGRACSQS